MRESNNISKPCLFLTPKKTTNDSDIHPFITYSGTPGVYNTVLYKSSLQYGSFTSGTYYIKSIQIEDNAGNKANYINYSYHNSDYYTHYDFFETITNTDIPVVTLIRP